MRDYVQEARPRDPAEPAVRFETPPGRQGQVGYGTFKLPCGCRHALLVVPGHSRLLWLRFYPRQTMAVLFDGLESAFARFGGVPAELLFDQMRAVVLSDDRTGGGELVMNAEFLRFSAHWALVARSCRAHWAQTRNKAERPIRHLHLSGTLTSPPLAFMQFGEQVQLRHLFAQHMIRTNGTLGRSEAWP